MGASNVGYKLLAKLADEVTRLNSFLSENAVGYKLELKGVKLKQVEFEAACRDLDTVLGTLMEKQDSATGGVHVRHVAGTVSALIEFAKKEFANGVGHVLFARLMVELVETPDVFSNEWTSSDDSDMYYTSS